MEPGYGAMIPTQAGLASTYNGSAVPAQAQVSSPVNSAFQPAFTYTVDSNGVVVAMPVNAYKNNERIFPGLKQGLSQADGYVASAEKLNMWLSKDRAYYPAARPWIVDFLETAQLTVREACQLGTTETRPFHISQCPLTESYWVDPYVKLVETVRGFQRFFGVDEPELRSRLAAVLRTVPPGTVVSSLPVQRSPSVPTTQALQTPNSAPIIMTSFHATPPGPRSPQVPPPAHPAFAPSVNRDIITSPTYPSPTTSGPFMQVAPFVRPPPQPVASTSPTPSVGHTQASPASTGSSSMVAASPTIVGAPPPQNTSKPRLKTKLKGKLPGIIGAFDYLDSDLEWYMKQKEKEQQTQKVQETKQETGSVAEGEDKAQVLVSEGVADTAHGMQEVSNQEVSVATAAAPPLAEPSLDVAPHVAQTKVEEEPSVALTDGQTRLDPQLNAEASAEANAEANVEASNTIMQLVTESEASAPEVPMDVEHDTPVRSSQPPEDLPHEEMQLDVGPLDDTPVVEPSEGVAPHEPMDVDYVPEAPHADESERIAEPLPNAEASMADEPPTPPTPQAQVGSPPPKTPPPPHTPPPAPQAQIEVDPVLTNPTRAASSNEPNGPGETNAPVTPHLDLSTKLKPSLPLRPTVKGKPGRKGPPGLRIHPVAASSNAVPVNPAQLTSPSPQPQPVTEPSPSNRSPPRELPKATKPKRRGPPGIRARDFALMLEAQASQASDRESSPETTLMSSIAKPKSPQVGIRKPRVASPTTSDSDSPLATRRKVSISKSRKTPALSSPISSAPATALPSSSTQLEPVHDPPESTSKLSPKQPEDVEMRDVDEPDISVSATTSSAHTKPRPSERDDSAKPSRSQDYSHLPLGSEAPPSHQRHDYTLESFASGSFVYPLRASQDREEGEHEPLDHSSLAEPEREPGEVTPVVETQPENGSLASALGLYIGHQRSPPTTLGTNGANLNLGLGPSLVATPPPVARAQLFDDGMRVLSFERGTGQSQSAILSFDIDDEAHMSLTAWVDRYTASHDDDAAAYRCISLACHPFSECETLLDGPNTPDLAEVFIRTPIGWPLRAHPRAIINDGKGPGRTLPITPLSIVEGNLVDISSKLQPGKNTVTIESTHGDTQDYVFVVHLHSPIAAQMQELQTRRDQETAWQQLLQDCAKIEVPMASVYMTLDASILVT